MKVLIAVVMFLFGLFVGILVIPTFKEFSTPLYLEEEYSTPRIKSLLSGFGIVLPLEASNVNLFMKQDGENKQVWMKFECSEEVKDEFVTQLASRHSGLFNRVIEAPKMLDGTPIIWWTYSNAFHYYEFKDMCVAYDEVLRNLYLYAATGDSDSSVFPAQEE